MIKDMRDQALRIHDVEGRSKAVVSNKIKKNSDGNK